MVPASICLAIFFFGIEELAVQLEEPFSVLPMHTYTNGIGNIANSYVAAHMDSSEILEKSVDEITASNEKFDAILPNILEPIVKEASARDPSFGYTFSPNTEDTDDVKP